jgi:hypothetical protein
MGNSALKIAILGRARFTEVGKLPTPKAGVADREISSTVGGGVD